MHKKKKFLADSSRFAASAGIDLCIRVEGEQEIGGKSGDRLTVSCEWVQEAVTCTLLNLLFFSKIVYSAISCTLLDFI